MSKKEKYQKLKAKHEALKVKYSYLFFNLNMMLQLVDELEAEILGPCIKNNSNFKQK
jgi:hypothetical protein